MCDGDADNHCLVLVNNAEVLVLHRLIDAAELKIELQGHISHILVAAAVFR